MLDAHKITKGEESSSSKEESSDEESSSSNEGSSDEEDINIAIQQSLGIPVPTIPAKKLAHKRVTEDKKPAANPKISTDKISTDTLYRQRLMSGKVAITQDKRSGKVNHLIQEFNKEAKGEASKLKELGVH
jgi:hypothetical protein